MTFLFMNRHSLDRSEMSEDDLQAFGAAGSGQGAYLIKQDRVLMPYPQQEEYNGGHD